MLGFLNCDDVCMRVFDESFELLEFVVYVNLQNDEISLVITARYVCLWCLQCVQSKLSESCQNLEQPCQCVAFVCMGSAVAVGVAIVVFNVTWVFVADGELTGTGG